MQADSCRKQFSLHLPVNLLLNPTYAMLSFSDSHTARIHLH